ncbi:MAG: ribosomal protein L3 N(5)-glutamine methyltransferase [Legionellales bacterium RIFCSPHIGHO2_12_FULL_42_9]|nr:MAG: ribosomal protein L3 N(5)-glutamine methyltransferase [Legionellales bacterium RIFCSPHIGHO2_12_FULL_42_9]
MSYSLFKKEAQELTTILDFWRYGVSRANEHELVYGHGTDNAEEDIWSLIAATLSLPFSVNPLFLQATLTQQEKTKLMDKLVARIIQRIPVPYLLKEANFCGLSFFVDERVLIPRSPIAELIQQQFSPWIDADNVTRILDLCTGSGCIAIACCEAFPEAMVDAVDVSVQVLEVAAINQKRHHVQEELHLIHSDCWEQVPAGSRYDIIVSNPPYVGDAEMSILPAEYQHEPDLALRASHNGLAVVEKILLNAHHYLSEQGILVVEVGNSQEALIEAYPEVPFVWLEFAEGGDGVFLLTAEQLQVCFNA